MSAGEAAAVVFLVLYSSTGAFILGFGLRGLVAKAQVDKAGPLLAAIAALLIWLFWPVWLIVFRMKKARR